MENQLRATLDELERMLEQLKKADNQPKPAKKTDKEPEQAVDPAEAVKRLKKVPFLVNLPQYTK